MLRADYQPRHFLMTGIAVALGYWLIESFNDSFIKEVGSFVRAIFTPPWYELWTRVLVAVFFVMAGFFIDKLIRKRRIAEAELEKSLNETKFLAYSVSHDLKSPSISLHGLVERLRTRCEGILDEKSREYFRLIQCAAEQIVALVETVNVFISTRELPINPEMVKLKEIFETIKDEFYPQMETKGVKLIFRDTDAEIRFDRLSLVRALRNLTSNSLKHGKNVKEICIQYEDAGDYHQISVKDDGEGVIPADQEKIFKPFVRGKSAKGIAGTGLGLAIVKEIAEKQGGEVWFEPGPDKGVTFNFSIPKNF